MLCIVFCFWLFFLSFLLHKIVCEIRLRLRSTFKSCKLGGYVYTRFNCKLNHSYMLYHKELETLAMLMSGDSLVRRYRGEDGDLGVESNESDPCNQVWPGLPHFLCKQSPENTSSPSSLPPLYQQSVHIAVVSFYGRDTTWLKKGGWAGCCEI